ncbi:hypothetical protein FGO68_gene9786 [Halteria grandinella]|uniref:Uncharacterized protein n=1 Tax=Halteria grandinella TaxID=5974 RepID=A0A8J8NAG2_HALGN|nr:hypothetical protein FGO68_gene9786 [Halteria grandinella]
MCYGQSLTPAKRMATGHDAVTGLVPENGMCRSGGKAMTDRIECQESNSQDSVSIFCGEEQSRFPGKIDHYSSTYHLPLRESNRQLGYPFHVEFLGIPNQRKKRLPSRGLYSHCFPPALGNGSESMQSGINSVSSFGNFPLRSWNKQRFAINRSPVEIDRLMLPSVHPQNMAAELTQMTRAQKTLIPINTAILRILSSRAKVLGRCNF